MSIPPAAQALGLSGEPPWKLRWPLQVQARCLDVPWKVRTQPPVAGFPSVGETCQKKEQCDALDQLDAETVER